MKTSRSFPPATLYSYASCDTCRRATRWLTSHGIDFVEKPIRETPPGKSELRRGLEAVRGDYRKIFNTSGRDYRAHSIGELLPTLNEAGIAGYDLPAWFAAFVPAKTPRPVVDKLNAALREALADKEVSGKLQAAGIEPDTGSPDELKAFVNSEIKKWAKIVADAKIEPE